MKKLIAMVLSVIMVASLAACGQTSTTAKKEIIVWNAGIQTSDPAGEIEKKDLPVYGLISEFEASHPDYKVTLVDYSMDDLIKAFTSANMAKKGPDMVAMWAGSSTLSFQDYLVDFNQYLTEDEKAQYDVSSLLHKNSNSSEELIGVKFGMPSTFIMYYNREIFEENNLEVPKTWSELIEVSKTLQDNEITPMVLGDKDGYTSTWAVSSLLANLLGPDNIHDMAPGGSVTMSGPEFTQAMETWQSYVADGYVTPDYLTKSDGDAIQDFVQGKGAMLIHGNWSSSEFEAMGDKVDVVQIPVIDDTPYADYIVSQPNINLSVTNYSDKIDATVELAKMLASPEFTVKSNETMYSQPVASRLAEKSDGFALEGKNVTGFDSIISGEAANEFYKLAPTYLNGTTSLADLSKKLDDLNK